MAFQVHKDVFSTDLPTQVASLHMDIFSKEGLDRYVLSRALRVRRDTSYLFSDGDLFQGA
ncbi:unnamed protein product [Fusarium venenatum]|uniref:Uncharacterized protein n=1 Tax=Fusarium venenatum TaxID=56646 RepID=A0A2L2TB81_9HYPO|nr:uncharacterized protein FVRRES_08299 [Fusarium venenatum]CEI68222.1 unnamed protein product [Fusarium venenatum]